MNKFQFAIIITLSISQSACANKDCIEILDDTERLACYDESSGFNLKNTKTSTTPTSQFDKYKKLTTFRSEKEVHTHEFKDCEITLYSVIKSHSDEKQEMRGLYAYNLDLKKIDINKTSVTYDGNVSVTFHRGNYGTKVFIGEHEIKNKRSFGELLDMLKIKTKEAISTGIANKELIQNAGTHVIRDQNKMLWGGSYSMNSEYVYSRTLTLLERIPNAYKADKPEIAKEFMNLIEVCVKQ